MKQTVQARDFPQFWANCINAGRIDDVVGLYSENAVLMPTFSPHAARDEAGLRAYFTQLSSREELGVKLHENVIDCLRIADDGYVVNGIYSFQFKVDGTLLTFPSRFTFVIDLARERPILHHHSSQIPRTLT